MNRRFFRITAAALALAILSGCAASEEDIIPDAPSEPSVTADAAVTLPEPAPETEPVVSTEPVQTGELTDDTAAAEETDPEETTALPGYTVEAFSAKMYATDTLNVRETPSTDAKVVGQLNPGDEVIVIGYASNGWYQIEFDGGKPFAYAEYISMEKPQIYEEALTIPENYRFSDASDYFFIVNKEQHLPEDYSIETDFVQGSYEMEIVAAKHCKDMIAAAKKDGIDLKVLSAYRTVAYQQKLFERNVNSRMENDGMSYEEAVADVSINIAPPGGSEHNAGLAVDIIDRNHWDTYTAFENTKEFEWLMAHCHEYGFILRYLKGKESITGYIYEPWHFRYVGTAYAKKVMDSGLCLEEYLEQYG